MNPVWTVNIPAEKLAFVARRARWVLDEAQSVDGKYDQAIARILRVLSNFVDFGMDLSSEGVKRVNRRLSVAAYAELIESRDFKTWHKKTTNEHQKELAFLFDEIRHDFITAKKIWTVDDLLDDLHQWPMTTMLKSEACKLANKCSPAERYVMVELQMQVVQTPWDLVRNSG